MGSYIFNNIIFHFLLGITLTALVISSLHLLNFFEIFLSLFANKDIANKAAFLAPASPIAKVAVGIPYGICTIDNKLSSPFISLLSIGTPNTGILVNEATIPGR